MPGASSNQPELRALRSPAELKAAVALQREIWGSTFSDVVPASTLLVAQEVGGIALGAFDSERLLGFVFGLTGPRDGCLVHWSDLLAVRPEARDRGLGRRLKLAQREALLRQGITRVLWSYDPLAARNAHFNLMRLGARPVAYVPDFYAAEVDEPDAPPADRLIVEWAISEMRVSAIVAGAAPDVRRFIAANLVDDVPLPADASTWRLEIPADWAALAAADRAEARARRARTRRVFTAAFEQGWRAAGFWREDGTGRCFYAFEKEG